MPVRHVLVVDDSKSARLMLRKMLQGAGLSVDAVESAEEALNYLRNQRPHAIFMDHTMPGLDGLAAVRQIKQDPRTAMIPIMMYTSKDSPAYQEEARSAGAMGVLVKPATSDELGLILEQMNVLFDEVAAQVASASPSSAAPTSAEVITTEQFEKLALAKAESAVYDAIESQILPLLNDVIAKVRRELEASQEERCERIAARICEERLARWQAPAPDARAIQAVAETAIQSQVPSLLAERFEELQRQGQARVDEQMREIVHRMHQGQAHELAERLLPQLSARFTEATRKAEETAHQAALQAARDMTLQTMAEKNATHPEQIHPAIIAEQTFRSLWEETRRGVWRHIHVAAGWAAALGVGAALLTHWLR